jgi:hypothetical protein
MTDQHMNEWLALGSLDEKLRARLAKLQLLLL